MLSLAIIVIQKLTFRSIIPKFLVEKMTLCNNKDQTWFSDTLTSARPLGGHSNPRLSGSGFNATLWVQQMLMHRKTCLIPIMITYEPVHEISNNVVCATSKAPDQPAYMRSLIRAFACCLNIL